MKILKSTGTLGRDVLDFNKTIKFFYCGDLFNSYGSSLTIFSLFLLGGWIMVGNAVVNREEEAKEVDMYKIGSSDCTQLAKVKSGRFLLSTRGLSALYDKYDHYGLWFSEIRFDCRKSYHKRRVHLKTTDYHTPL